MPGPLELPPAWESVHQTKPASEQPEEEVIAFLEWVRARSSAQATLLDAGCGRGRNLLALSQAGFRVHACDLSRAALRVAKARAHEAGVPARFLAANLANLPFFDNFFAAAICVHVLPYHFKAGLVRCLHELWRVLQPNGRLYLDLLDLEDAEYGRGRKLEEHTFLDPDGMPLHFSSRQEIDELTKGFVLEQVNRHEFSPSPARRRVSWRVWATK